MSDYTRENRNPWNRIAAMSSGDASGNGSRRQQLHTLAAVLYSA
jgi:hypothetical protein